MSCRASVTRRLRGFALPDAFVQATVAAEAHLLAKSPKARTEANKRDLKRIASQARRIEQGER